MINDFSFLSIIPARAGSKGLKNKNIKPLLGHPLIAYSIQSALQCRFSDRVLVSTDCQKIQSIAISYGAEASFLRPPDISLDNSRDVDFLRHTLLHLKEVENRSFDFVLLLRPTSPVRPQHLLETMIQTFLDAQKKQNLDSFISITECPVKPHKIWNQKDGLLIPFFNDPNIREPHSSPRQLLPDGWIGTGILDIISVDTIFAGSSLGKKIGFFRVPKELYLDIDNSEDFEKAQNFILKNHLFSNLIKSERIE